MNTIGLWGVFGLTDQYRVLASSAGGDELLAAHGGVVDEGRDVDVINSSLTRLVVAREAP